jgi:hypothetical protein
MIFPSKVTNTPANSVVFVAHENCFVATRASLSSKLRWYCGKTLAPPYAEMGEIGFGTVHDFIGGSVEREGRSW